MLSAIDLSGRPYLNFDATFTCDKLGELDTEMVKEFFYAVSYSGAMNLHLKSWMAATTIIWQRRCLKHLEKRLIWLYPKNHG